LRAIYGGEDERVAERLRVGLPSRTGEATAATGTAAAALTAASAGREEEEEEEEEEVTAEAGVLRATCDGYKTREGARVRS